jgi:ParB/RepB/Spo0J family partition protein
MPLLKSKPKPKITPENAQIVEDGADPGPPSRLELARSNLQVFDIPMELLVESAENPNEMDDKMFDQFVEKVKEEGFDEPIKVVPHPDGRRYFIVAGHHRVKAGKLLKMTAVPGVVKENWDDDKRKLELVANNMVKGNLNPEKFTALYNDLAKKYDKEILKAMMGFTKKDAFDKVYKAVSDKLPARQKKQLEDAKETIRSVDDLSSVLNTIFKEGGSELSQGYMVFSFGGKEHIYIQADAELHAATKHLIEEAKTERVHIGTALLAAIRKVDLTLAPKSDTTGAEPRKVLKLKVKR